MTAPNRQLTYLKLLSQWYHVLVVLFEDVGMNDYVRSLEHSTEECYQHVTTEKFANEKRLIISTLRQHDIYSVLTTLDKLSIDAINKYSEMKRRQIST